jgi:quercetin dioxygenase-like cupin family protein
MQRTSLDALARELLEKAATATGGHSAETVCGGHEKVLRQTVIAMTQGSKLGEHANPGEATVLVLAGRVRLWTEAASWEGRRGDLIIVPDTRHSLEAMEEGAVLLTVVKVVALSDARLNRSVVSSSVRPTPATASIRVLEPLNTLVDIVDEWGKHSFPASDPPQNW